LKLNYTNNKKEEKMETKKCEDCGDRMEKYSPLNGQERKRCLDCARKLPDPLADENILD